MRRLLLLLFSLPLFGEPVSIRFDASICVYNSVNVASGMYFEAHRDLTVRGVEPIVLHRSHISNDYQDGHRGYWRFHDERLYTQIEKKGKDHRVYLKEASGGGVTFKPNVSCGYHEKDPDSWDADPICEDGYCNSSTGELSGKHHIGNYRLHFDRKKDYRFTLTKGDGEVRIYGHQKKKHHFRRARKKRNEDTIGEEFGLLEVIRPNGNRLVYTYDDEARVIEIQAFDRFKNVTLASVHFEYAQPNRKEVLRITTSDGQTVDYNYVEHIQDPNVRYKLRYPRLDRVTCNSFFEKQYEYAQDRISRQKGPCGEYLAIDYVKGQKANGSDNDQDCFRVGRQYVPFGPKNTETNLATFHYDYGRGEEPGWTDVLDAFGNLTRYHHSTHKRVHLIERFEGRKTLISSEIFERKGPDLVGHYCIFPDRTTYYARELEYDERHNVTKETYLGNLTGTPSGHVHVDPIYSWDRRQKKKKWEKIRVGPRRIKSPQAYTKTYTYSHDGYNNLLTESYDNVKVAYTYLPNTDLIETKETYVDSTLTETEGYTYDTYHRLTHHTYSTPTHTFCKEITSSPLGLPETIHEYALDNGQRLPIRTTYYTYSEQSLILTESVEDANGDLAYTLSYTYDPAGRLTSKTDALNQTTTYTYDLSGNCIEEKTPTTTTHTCYDLAARPIQVTKTDQTALTTHVTYDLLGRPISQTDPFGTTTYTYDRDGHPLTKTDALGQTTTYTYDPSGNCTSKTDPLGYTTTTTYNDRNQPIQIIYPDNTSECFTYFLNGQLHTHTDKTGLKTTYTRDYKDRPLTITLSLGNNVFKKTTHTYVGDYLTSTIHPDATITTYTYNALGQLIQQDHEGDITTYSYDALGRQTETTRGQTTTCVTYDLLNRPICEETLSDSILLTTQAYTYDFDGNKTSISDGGAVTHITYSQLGPTSTTDPLNNQTHTTYTFNPFTITTTDPLGNTTTTTHDPLGRIASITKPNLAITYAYDALSRPVLETHNDYTLSYTYDSLGRLLTLTENQTRTTTHTYDLYGRLASTTKPSGATTHFSYDPLGRLHTHSGPDFSDTYAYDAADRLLSIASQTGTTRRTYNRRGHLTSETLATRHTITYIPNTSGQIETIVLPDGSDISYTYLGPFIATLTRNGYTFCYTYDQKGLLTDTESPIQSTHTRYDPLGRPLSITAPSLTQTLTYDSLGNLLSIDTTDPAGSLSASYTYDALSQIASENDTPYPHDALGNLTTDTTDTFNQLLASKNASLTYDLDGQPTTLNDARYTYDSRGRLTSIETDTLTLTFTYDPFHRRLSKTLLQKNKLLSYLDYLYMGDDEIGAVSQNRIVELRPLGPGLGAEIGAAPLIELDGEPYFPLYDYRGSTSVLLSSWNNVQEVYRYDAFGDVTIRSLWGQSTTSFFGNPYQFLSKRTDEETHLTYFGRRYYSPSLRRWLTPDPSGHTDGPNLYTYCHSNPTSYLDLYGLESGSKTDFAFMSDASKFDSSISSFSPNAPPRLYPHQATAATFDQAVYRSLTYDRAANSMVFRGDLSDLGLPELPGGGRIAVVGGARTTLGDARNYALYISGLAGNINVRYFVYPTQGTLRDFFRARHEVYAGLLTPVADALHQEFKSFFDQASPKVGYLVFPFSEGTATTKNTLMSFPQADRNRIVPVCLCPSGYIPHALNKNAVHYRGSHDIVSWLDLRGRMRCHDTSTTLRPVRGATWTDHNPMSPTYEPFVQDHIDDYISSLPRSGGRE